ncbi:MAG: thiamine phosphate synthase [Deltaproteobacteria bacterium]|nr:thiamine phosphate synthase [Deltaproteobacteria bacterium]
MRPPFDLYLVTDRQQTQGRLLPDVVREAVQAGVPAVQLRERGLEARELLGLATTLRAITRQAGALLLINDRLDVALACGADGVHLPQDGIPPREARHLLGPDRLIGVSTHSLAEARRAEAGGADFIVLGPIYATPSKLSYGPPRGLEVLRVVTEQVRLPVLAIGGIKAGNVAEVLGAGAAGVALISAIIAATDVPAAARALRQALAASRHAPIGAGHPLVARIG